MSDIGSGVGRPAHLPVGAVRVVRWRASVAHGYVVEIVFGVMGSG
jgi:hypothetical protein